MGDTYPRFKVAAVQAASVFFDRDKNIDKAVRLIEEAADQGAAIIGFPELFVSGHPGGYYYGRKSNPLPGQGKIFKEVVKNALKVPSPAADRLCKAARRAHAYVVMGMSEADPHFPGTLYMSQLFISADGEIMGVHRKLVTTNVEKLVYSNGDGSHLNVYDTAYGKLSGLNCGEHTHSLFRYALLAMGTQIHVAAWPSFPNWSSYTKSPKDQIESIAFRVRQFAHEGKIFVISSCAVTDEQNIAFCAETEEDKAAVTPGSGGGSSIIGPSGEYLAGPLVAGEGVLTAEISLEDALPGKQTQNVLGHYTRWDVLSLHLNRKRLSPFQNSLDPDENLGQISSVVGELRSKISEMDRRLETLTRGRKRGESGPSHEF